MLVGSGTALGVYSLLDAAFVVERTPPRDAELVGCALAASIVQPQRARVHELAAPAATWHLRTDGEPDDTRRRAEDHLADALAEHHAG